MPSDQGRRHPRHHFGGFLSLALHRTKSKSSEHLDPESQKLDKRVLSSRDLAAGTGFDNVLAELNKKTKFKKSGSSSSLEGNKQRKSCTEDTIPFSVKYSVSKDNTTTMSTSVAVVSTNSQPQTIPNDGDPDMLDQALSNIRTKLKEMSIERTSMESRLEALEDGLEKAYIQYRLKHPDSKPLPLFPDITPFNVGTAASETTDEVDGLDSGSSSMLSNSFNGVSSVTSITSLPSNLHTRLRGGRYLTAKVDPVTVKCHTWQPEKSDMVELKHKTENTAPKMANTGSPQSPLLNSTTSVSSIPSPHRATHHILNTTPPSSPKAEHSPLARTKGLLTQPTHALTSTAQGPGPTPRTRAYALSQATNTPGSSHTLPKQKPMHAFPATHGMPPMSASQQAQSQPTPSLSGPSFNKSGQLRNRNSLPDGLATSTIFEETTAGDNSNVSAPQRTPAFRRRSASSGYFERPSKSKSQLLTRRTSQDSLKKLEDRSSGRKGYVWFEDF